MTAVFSHISDKVNSSWRKCSNSQRYCRPPALVNNPAREKDIIKLLPSSKTSLPKKFAIYDLVKFQGLWTLKLR